MQFKSTLVGAVVGAATGVAIHVAIEVFGRIEAPWFAMIIGLLVGLFVRFCDKSCAGHVSYVRGAIAGLIALSAIVGGTYLLGVALTKQAAHANRKVVSDLALPTQDVGVDAAPDNPEKHASELESNAMAESPRLANDVGDRRVGRSGNFSILQFIFIAIGTFIAYELGRGTEPKNAPQLPTVNSPVASDARSNSTC